MHSSCDDVETTGVDAIARELAGEGLDARRANARTEAALARVFAKAAHVGARRVAELASPSSREAELPYRALAAELGAAMNMSDRTVQRRMNDAAVLDELFPATFEAWDEGRITGAHVAVIREHGLPLTDPEARGKFETEALIRAEGTTPGRLGAALARIFGFPIVFILASALAFAGALLLLAVPNLVLPKPVRKSEQPFLRDHLPGEVQK